MAEETTTTTTTSAPETTAQTTQGAEQQGNLLDPNGGQEQQQQQTTQGAEQQGNLLDPNNGQEQQKEEGAPEQYGEFTLPEGYEFEGEAKDEVLAAFKEMNLSQAKAQRLMDTHVRFLEKFKENVNRGIEAQIQQWKDEVRSRPSYNEERGYAARAMRVMCTTPEEKAVFSDGQLANNPAVWSMMVKVGRLLSEDTIGRGGGNAPASERMFKIDMGTLN